MYEKIRNKNKKKEKLRKGNYLFFLAVELLLDEDDLAAEALLFAAIFFIHLFYH